MQGVGQPDISELMATLREAGRAWATNYDNRNGDARIEAIIWRQPDGTLQAARGQARIPDAAALQRLISAAHTAGWY